MPVWSTRYWSWREKLAARPGEARAHAEMRADRSRRKQLRKLRRRQGLA